MYCKYCGGEINDNAVLCVHCGGQVAELKTEITPPKTISISKSKTSAILLAIIFGPLSWLYTYGKNKQKFWGSILMYVAYFAFMISYSCSMIFGDPVKATSSPLIINAFYIILAFTWLWPIAEYSIRPVEYYINYQK